MTDKHTQPLEPTVTAGESDLVCFGTTATYALAPIMPDIANLIGRLRDGERLSQRDMDNLREEAATALAELQADINLWQIAGKVCVAQCTAAVESCEKAEAENKRLVETLGMVCDELQAGNDSIAYLIATAAAGRTKKEPAT